MKKRSIFLILTAIFFIIAVIIFIMASTSDNIVGIGNYDYSYISLAISVIFFIIYNFIKN